MNHFRDRIHAIVADREHGSSTLIEWIIDTLGDTRHLPTNRSEQRWALQELRRIDRSMVVVHHLLDALGSEPGDDLPERVRQYAQQWSNLPSRITRGLLASRDWRNARVLLHSHSGLLLAAATEAHQRAPGIRFWQTRSEPGAEGVSQHAQLDRRGVPCTLLADHAAIATPDLFDAALLGTDQFDDRHFVNKVGSQRIARALVTAGKNVFVLGDSRKRVERLDYSEQLFEAAPFTEGVWLVTEDGVYPAGRD